MIYYTILQYSNIYMDGEYDYAAELVDRFTMYHRRRLVYYTILCHAMLYHAMLYYTISYYTIPCYAILYYTSLYYTILCLTVLNCGIYYTVYFAAYHTILCTILYHALHYTTLYYTTLYCTILYYTILYISYVCKSGVGDVLIGAAAAIAEYNGVEQASHIKDKLVSCCVV